MKYIKIFRTLAVALTIALLAVAVAVPATPALAAANIFVTPNEGEIGDEVLTYGYGFTAGSSVDIYFSSDSAVAGDYLDSEVTAYERVAVASVGTEVGVDEGEIDAYFVVPDRLNDGDDDVKVRGGTYYVYATSAGSKKIKGVVDFTVEAVGEITLDIEEGTVGTEVDITGLGFGDREDIIVEYDGVNVAIESGDDATDTDGEFELTILIPESTAGEHDITVIGDDTNIEVMAVFTVEAKITISPESGAAGDTITVSGTGFGDRVDFSIFFDDVEAVADETTDRDGSFEITFAALARGAGSYDVEVEDADGNSDTVAFTMGAAAASLNLDKGAVGDSITVSGTGFKASQPVSIYFDNELASTASTDSNGAFNGSFTVPVMKADTYKVKVSDGTNIVEADFSIVTSASISPATSTAAPGYVGSELTVSGIGFTAGGAVTITYDGNQVATVAVSPDGTFSAPFKAPAGSGGAHTVIANVDGITNSFTFVMESTPPPIPKPLKPEMDIKAESEAYFDWEDVTDPSGVTYALQIATDENFTQGSIVLEKTGLTESEYTITKVDRLQSVSKEAPYYWHIKAIDGAYNESLWTGNGSFYVGFSMALPQPVIYILFGIGALLFGILGFWLGGKTAYY